MGSRTPERPARCAGPGRGARWRAAPDEGGERSELLLIFSILDDGNININIKSFRAVTARATFLCLCKETWRQESTPRLRARCCAPGSRSRRDFPSGHPALADNAAHPCASPCGSDPPAPPLRRGPESHSQSQPQRRKPGPDAETLKNGHKGKSE